MPYTCDDEQICGSIAIGTPISAAMSSSHVSVSQVHQQGAGRVRDVGEVQTAVGAAGAVPEQPGVHGAEAAGRRAPRPPGRRPPRPGSSAPSGRRSTWPAAGPYRRGSARGRRRAPPSSSQIRWVRVSCQTIALCTGRPGAPVPHHRRLALVRDAHGGDVLGRRVGTGQRAGHDAPRVLPDLQRVVLHPAGAREDLPVLHLVGGDDPAAPGRTGCTACSSSPGRWPPRTATCSSSRRARIAGPPCHDRRGPDDGRPESAPVDRAPGAVVEWQHGCGDETWPGKCRA